MSYLATYTESNAAPVVIGEFYTLADSSNACQHHLSDAWERVYGLGKFSDPSHAYDRGQFNQWNGIPRLYVTAPNGEAAHYDIAELPR